VLVRQLLHAGIAVRAACRTPAKGAKLAQLGAEVVAGDLLDPNGLREAMRGCDVIFHVAAATGDAILCYTTNVQGTVNVVRAAHQVGAERLVHVSTVAVYGYDITGTITEDTPHRPNPNDYYSTSKSAGELILWTYTQELGLPAVSVRPAFVYGPRSAIWSLMLYRAAHYGLPLVDGGTGDAHPIFVDDVADLLVLAGNHPAAPGQAFNAGPAERITWREFGGYYMRMAGNERSLAVPLAPLRPLGMAITLATRLRGAPFDLNSTLRYMGHRAQFSIAKAQTLLGWLPRVGLEQGMMLTEPWLREKTGRSAQAHA
jgi:nucleoside-diphosphate-sugar epimerase